MATRIFLQVLLLASLSFPFPAKADFLSNFGVRPFWDMERTQEAFMRAGIDKYPSGDATGKLIRKVTSDFAAEWAQNAVEVITTPPFEPRIDCLFYRNGIEPRDDLLAVSVCFLERKYQHIVLAFFRSGAINAAALRQSLNEKYGKPNEDDVWSERPAIYGKLLATKDIGLMDFAGINERAVTSISAALLYINRPQMAEYISATRENMRQAAEKAKQDARKGL